MASHFIIAISSDGCLTRAINVPLNLLDLLVESLLEIVVQGRTWELTLSLHFGRWGKGCRDVTCSSGGPASRLLTSPGSTRGFPGIYLANDCTLRTSFQRSCAASTLCAEGTGEQHDILEIHPCGCSHEHSQGARGWSKAFSHSTIMRTIVSGAPQGAWGTLQNSLKFLLS